MENVQCKEVPLAQKRAQKKKWQVAHNLRGASDLEKEALLLYEEPAFHACEKCGKNVPDTQDHHWCEINATCGHLGCQNAAGIALIPLQPTWPAHRLAVTPCTKHRCVCTPFVYYENKEIRAYDKELSLKHGDRDEARDNDLNRCINPRSTALYCAVHNHIAQSNDGSFSSERDKMRRSQCFIPHGWIGKALPFAGCYAIFQDHKLIYIGSSQNVQKRISSHEIIQNIPEEMRDDVSIKCRYFHRKSYKWLTLEARLIDRLKPPMNSQFIESRKATA